MGDVGPLEEEFALGNLGSPRDTTSVDNGGGNDAGVTPLLQVKSHSPRETKSVDNGGGNDARVTLLEVKSHSPRETKRVDNGDGNDARVPLLQIQDLLKESAKWSTKERAANLVSMTAEEKAAFFQRMSTADVEAFLTPNEIDEVAQAQAQVDIMKAETMYKMLDQVTTKSGLDVGLVFFSNEQARLFDYANIEKLMLALNISTPKLGVRMLSADSGSHSIKGLPRQVQNKIRNRHKFDSEEDYYESVKEVVHEYYLSMDEDIIHVPGILPYETPEEAETAEFHLQLFCKEILVPLASETNAIVLGDCYNDQALFMYFCQSAQNIDTIGRGKNAFTTMGILAACDLVKSCEDQRSNVFDLYDGCHSWKKRLPRIKEALAEQSKNSDSSIAAFAAKKQKKKKKKKVERGVPARTADSKLKEGSEDGSEHGDDILDAFAALKDVNPYVTKVIAVDCLYEVEGKLKEPYLCMDSYNQLFPTIMNHYVSTLPCMAITSLHSADTDGDDNGADLSDTYGLCCMKVPVLVLDVRTRDEKLYQDPSGKILQGMDLFNAMKDVEENLFAKIKENGSADVYEMCRLSHFHSMLLQSPDVSRSGTSGHNRLRQAHRYSLWEAIARKRKSRDQSKEEDKKPLVKEIATFLAEIEYRAYWALFPSSYRKQMFDTGRVKNEEEGWKDFFEDSIKDSRLMYYNLLCSPYLYSAHAANLKVLENLVGDLSKKDKLPKENSLEALCMLQRAWDIVDVGAQVANRFKLMAKFLYLFLLVLAAAITIVTVLTDAVDRSVPMPESTQFKAAQLMIFSLSVMSSFVAGLMAYLNPVRRWQQVRHISKSMESAIWMFRTRTGPFATSDAADKDVPERRLKEHVLDAWNQLMVSADVQETSFSQEYDSAVFRHGQREPGRTVFGTNRVQPDHQGLADAKDMGVSESARNSTPLDLETGLDDTYNDHYCPLQPKAYIALRVQAMISFYRTRIPAYTRLRDWLSVIVMVGTSSGAFLSFLNYSQYVAIITSITSGIISYLEFHSTGKKLARYNTTVVSLEGALTWWYSISSVDKASTTNIHVLVNLVESILNAERVTWLSTAAKSKDDHKPTTDDNPQGKKDS